MLMLSGEPLQALGNTNVPERYGLCAAAVLVLWLLCRIGIILLQWIAQKPTAFLLKHFSYRLLPAVLRWLDTTTLSDGLVIIIYVIVNILCAVVGTHSWSQINIRLGILATVNFLPLLAGMGFGPSADAVGVHRHVYTQAHRWIGRVCALQAVVHGSISLATSSKGSWSDRAGSIPLVAGGAVVLTMLVTLSIVTRRHRAFAIKSHYALGLTAVGALWQHLVQQKSRCRWYLAGSLCFGLTVGVLSLFRSLYLNKRWAQPWPTAEIKPEHGVLHVEIQVPAKWRVRPGQYLRLWMPRVGFRDSVQLPPFVVAFWKECGDLRTLYLLIRPQSHGLTARLFTRTWFHRKRLPVLALGPHGLSYDFRPFGTVLFIANDIGIAGILPYIKALVDASKRRKAMVRKLEIVWQMDDSDNRLWVKDWMQELLDEDREGFEILRFHIYYRTNSGHMKGSPVSTRIDYFHKIPLNVEATLQHHLATREGDMAIGVCGQPSVANLVQSIVQPQVDESLRLMHLDFEPHRDCPNAWIEHSAASSHSHNPWVTSKILEGKGWGQ